VRKWQPQKEANCLHPPENISEVFGDMLVVIFHLSKIMPLVFRCDQEDFGVKVRSDCTQKGGSTSVDLWSVTDVLVACSTLPGFASNRDTRLGTWFIQAVCEIFMKHACDKDVIHMLQLVSLPLLPVLPALFYWVVE
jgi:hypothetical protein